MRTAIKNSGGIRGTLLIPDAPFELLVRRAINRLLAPALQCKEFVHSELLRVAAQCVPPDVARFPRLQASPPPSLPLCHRGPLVLAKALARIVSARNLRGVWQADRRQAWHLSQVRGP